MCDFAKLEFIGMSPAETSNWPAYPEYKKGRPKDRALIVSDGTNGCCIDHIGPGLAYWIEESVDDSVWDGIEAGVWIWEGGVRAWTSYEGEHDEELEGEPRALTEAEWSDFKLTETGPWDCDEWIAKYPGPPVVTVSQLEELLTESLDHIKQNDDLQKRIREALEF